MSALPYSVADLKLRILRHHNLSEGFSGDTSVVKVGTRQICGQRSHSSWKKAAVLLLFIEHLQQASLILTRRAKKLRDHSGQISFPGGKIDASDPSVEMAALREVEEEIGVSPSEIEVLGRLPCYYTGTGFKIYPVIGVAAEPQHFHQNRDEVDQILEVPLSFLMQPRHHRCELRDFEGSLWHFYTIAYNDLAIWGATAGMIRVLYERLYQ